MSHLHKNIQLDLYHNMSVYYNTKHAHDAKQMWIHVVYLYTFNKLINVKLPHKKLYSTTTNSNHAINDNMLILIDYGNHFEQFLVKHGFIE